MLSQIVLLVGVSWKKKRDSQGISYDSGHMTPTSKVKIISCFIVHIYSVGYNSIGDAGAQVLAEGLRHCTNLQELK